jgi:peptidoglycan/xylan/chitin deacetylase (PgdA/CDA1 family)
MSDARVHPVAGPPDTALARWLAEMSKPYGELSPLVGPFSQPIMRVSGPEALLEQAAHGLPAGAARAEAIAVRLRRSGVRIAPGKPDELSDTASFVRLCHARGASSVALVRADPSLLTELQLGSFFHAFWRRRLVRRAVCRLGWIGLVARSPAALIALAADTAFWLGVRSAATSREWERLTRSSYVVFYYHGVQDNADREQAHLFISPRRLERQLWWLRFLRFRPLAPEQLLAFHTDAQATLPPRSYVIAADDGFRDVVEAFRAHAHRRPQVFVNTAAVGGTAPWAYDTPLADWDELQEFQATGGIVASHGRGHPDMPQLAQSELEAELAGALGDLAVHFEDVPPLLAYPYGDHDERVRSAAAALGYRAAFTTEPGRNGAGIDPYCLRRLGVLDWDNDAAFLWKALSGELLPWAWERRRRRRRAEESGHHAAQQRDAVP